MEFVIVLIIIIVVAAIVSIAAKASARKAMSAELKKIQNFVATQEVMGEDAKTGFAFDENASKICLINKKGNSISTRIMHYRDILSVELFEDGESVTKTARVSQLGGALLGGIVFGPLGAVVGGLSGKKKSESKIKRLDLRLAVNDTASPVHDVCFLDIEVKKSSSLYKDAFKKATHWSSLVEALIRRADNEDQQNEQASQTSESTFSVPERIRELAKLRDEGLLTEEEFSAQKTKLLD